MVVIKFGRIALEWRLTWLVVSNGPVSGCLSPWFFKWDVAKHHGGALCRGGGWSHGREEEADWEGSQRPRVPFWLCFQGCASSSFPSRALVGPGLLDCWIGAKFLPWKDAQAVLWRGLPSTAGANWVSRKHATFKVNPPVLTKDSEAASYVASNSIDEWLPC